MSCLLVFTCIGEGWVITDLITYEKFETEALSLDLCMDEDIGLLETSSLTKLSELS